MIVYAVSVFLFAKLLLCITFAIVVNMENDAFQADIWYEDAPTEKGPVCVILIMVLGNLILWDLGWYAVNLIVIELVLIALLVLTYFSIKFGIKRLLK